MQEKIISVKDVMAYHGMSLVVNKVSFDVLRNEFVYLVGKTGSGKSSILRLLYGDLHLASGSAEVAGFDISKLNWKNVPLLRRKLGIVFQDFQLLTDRTVN